RGAKAAIELNPSDPIPNAVAGDALVELGDYDEAARAYARLAGLQGLKRPDPRLAWLSFLQGDAAGAVAGMRQAVTRAARTNPSAPRPSLRAWAARGRPPSSIRSSSTAPGWAR